MSLLSEIFAHKHREVAHWRRIQPLEQVRELALRAAPPLDFVAALREAPVKPALIAEIKFASPSRGLLALMGLHGWPAFTGKRRAISVRPTNGTS
jgi:indole-3-glycerol phosphate synthase